MSRVNTALAPVYMKRIDWVDPIENSSRLRFSNPMGWQPCSFSLYLHEADWNFVNPIDFKSQVNLAVRYVQAPKWSRPRNDPQTGPEMMPSRVPAPKLSPNWTRNDPQPRNDPQLDPKWSPNWTRNDPQPRNDPQTGPEMIPSRAPAPKWSPTGPEIIPR